MWREEGPWRGRVGGLHLRERHGGLPLTCTGEGEWLLAGRPCLLNFQTGLALRTSGTRSGWDGRRLRKDRRPWPSRWLAVSPADSSLARLEESPRFTCQAWLFQWGASHTLPKPASPISRRSPLGRLKDRLGKSCPWDAGASGLNETRHPDFSWTPLALRASGK